MSSDRIGTNTGAAIVVRALIIGLSRFADVTVFSPSTSSSLPENVSTCFVNVPSERRELTRYLLWLVRSLRLILEMPRYDIVFDTSLTFPLMGLLRLFPGSPPSVALVHDNGYLEDLTRGSPLVAALSLIRQQAEILSVGEVVTISEGSRQRLVSYYMFGKKIVVIPNGVEIEVFKKLSVPKERHILFVGNTVDAFSRKGIDNLLIAFRLITREFRDVDMIVVGRQDSELQSMVEDLGLSARVRLLGTVSQSRLVDLYNGALVVLIPSRFEGYSLVANEAMACGTPLVISNQVGAIDIVSKANAGLVFQFGNVDDLFQCVKRILEDEVLSNQLGRNGLNYARKNLSWQEISLKYLAEFSRLRTRHTSKSIENML